MSKPKKQTFQIEGTVKTQLGWSRFNLYIRSRESLGDVAAKFERENPDTEIRRIGLAYSGD